MQKIDIYQLITLARARRAIRELFALLKYNFVSTVKTTILSNFFLAPFGFLWVLG